MCACGLARVANPVEEWSGDNNNRVYAAALRGVAVHATFQGPARW
jgi:hypothetical protein